MIVFFATRAALFHSSLFLRSTGIRLLNPKCFPNPFLILDLISINEEVSVCAFHLLPDCMGPIQCTCKQCLNKIKYTADTQTFSYILFSFCMTPQRLGIPNMVISDTEAPPTSCQNKRKWEGAKRCSRNTALRPNIR